MITYIIRTKENEFYCGKTKDLHRRLAQHKQEKRPHWFAFKNRKEFIVLFKIIGDYEKKIKKFGIRNFVKCIGSLI